MKMNSRYFRTQQYMHPTNIKQEVGCLGPHEQILEVEDEHRMVFQEGVDLPFCITPKEHVVTKFSQTLVILKVLA